MTGDTPTTDVRPSLRANGGKYLTFYLADEEYGIEILKVQEIIGMSPITPVPRTPEFIRGVINLRGKVVPILDLRAKFSMPVVDATDETCIIVVKALGIEFGVVVDRVSEVLDIPVTQIDAPPNFGTAVDTDYILGLGKAEHRVRLLLDIDRVISTEEAHELAGTAAIAE